MSLANWQYHEPILLDFEAAWRDESPASIDDQLSGVPANQRIELLTELVMIDFEHRCRRNLATTLDGYFTTYPELLHNREVRDDLILHELRIRQKTGNFPNQAELESRFPGDTTVVELRNRIHTEPTPGAHVSTLLKPDTLVGRFKIAACVGSGAFATVYSAIDTELQRKVALKFLSVSSDVRPESRIRMLREAQATASLQHVNIVPVFDTGIFHGHDFIASKFVDGVTLAQLLDDQPPSIGESIEIVCQLASALEHAHCNGIVHRDIKPANVMIDHAGTPMLLDFGLAHFLDESHQLTHEGDLLGTPAFMSPEQADGHAWRADARSDVYSLGAVLYRLVCNRLPFTGTTTEVIQQVLHQQPESPRQHNKQISRDLQTIILKCLQKEGTQRYQTAAELERDLRNHQENRPITARPVGVVGQVARWARRHPVIAAMVFGILALASFGFGVGTQLIRVADERDRAKQAEQETQSLLAESAFDAGLLAMQRGQMSEAIRHFEQSLARGHSDRLSILLKLIEANVIKRNIVEAADRWHQAIALQSSPEDASQLMVWKAELALEGREELGNGVALMEQARWMDLPPAERAYADGVLAETSPDAVKALRLATQLAPFHHRARRLLIFTTFSLARLDEAKVELHTARQLFPEDPDFVLLDSLCLAASSQLELSLKNVDESTLDDETRDKWKTFCRALYDLSTPTDKTGSAGELGTLHLVEIAGEFNQEFRPLIRERQWRFPPRVGKRFELLTNDIATLLLGSNEQQGDAIERLTSVHPEGTLLTILGGLRLAEVDVRTGINEQQIRQLELSRAAFRGAIDNPGFLNKTDQLSWKGIFTTSVALAFNYKHKVKENHREILEAASHVDSSTLEQAQQARTFSIVTLTLEDFEESARWLKRWVVLAQDEDDEDSLIDAYYHTAILSKRNNDWLGVKSNCDRVLARQPNNDSAIALKKAAMIELNIAVGALESTEEAK